jgi:hypothetical protein
MAAWHLEQIKIQFDPSAGFFLPDPPTMWWISIRLPHRLVGQ